MLSRVEHPYAILIPSRNPRNLGACIAAIRDHDEPGTIVVIDDGLDESPPFGTLAVPGVHPFVWSRNINIGIRRTAPLDVVICGDDVTLESQGGFHKLSNAAYHAGAQHPCIVSAAIKGIAGNDNQLHRPATESYRTEPEWLAFVCIYLPRLVIAKVGLLDERYVGYGCDDYDYSLRCRLSDIEMGISELCIVSHGELPSEYREGSKREQYDQLFSYNKKALKQKWGL
jgi:GT2 family glycosyltransferase